MARPEKNTVEYFPHPVTHGKKMSYLEKKYGNDGYATWFKILEEMGNTEYHYLDLSDDVQLMFLSDRCLVSEKLLTDIIGDLIRLKEFDKKLWEENRILFNEKFIESIKDAYKKRSNACINKNSLFILLDSLGIRKQDKSKLKPQKSESEVSIKPQTKLDYTKLDKTRESARAIDFLKNNFPSRFETDFLMKYKSKIENPKKFVEDFNDTVDQEKLEFDDKVLFGRLGKYARNWIENQSKSQKYSSNDTGNSSDKIPVG